jgi:hypothetical protein
VLVEMVICSASAGCDRRDHFISSICLNSFQFMYGFAVDAIRGTIVTAKGLRVMATFYVLPSRHHLGQRIGDLLTSLFPGARVTHWDWPDLAESLGALVESQGDAHVVYREDIDEQLSVKDALLRDFGAALDDEIFALAMVAIFREIACRDISDTVGC